MTFADVKYLDLDRVKIILDSFVSPQVGNDVNRQGACTMKLRQFTFAAPYFPAHKPPGMWYTFSIRKTFWMPKVEASLYRLHFFNDHVRDCRGGCSQALHPCHLTCRPCRDSRNGNVRMRLGGGDPDRRGWRPHMAVYDRERQGEDIWRPVEVSDWSDKRTCRRS